MHCHRACLRGLRPGHVRGVGIANLFRKTFPSDQCFACSNCFLLTRLHSKNGHLVAKPMINFRHMCPTFWTVLRDTYWHTGVDEFMSPMQFFSWFAQSILYTTSDSSVPFRGSFVCIICVRRVDVDVHQFLNSWATTDLPKKIPRPAWFSVCCEMFQRIKCWNWCVLVARFWYAEVDDSLS